MLKLAHKIVRSVAYRLNACVPAPESFPQQTTILAKIKPYTMVSKQAVCFTIQQLHQVIDADIPGVFVECGVWRGGVCMAVLLTQKAQYGKVLRPVHLFDSFAGLPKVEAIDGPLANAWQTSKDTNYRNNCQADADEVRTQLHALGFTEHQDFFIHHGWFNESLPVAKKTLKQQGIAILRLDGDWYESTLTCLTHLEPLTSEEGIVILDDYYSWDGCAQAAHDYLSNIQIPYRLKSLEKYQGAFFIKRKARRSYDEF